MRLTGASKTPVIRAPARPASARPTETNAERSRSVRRPNRRVSPGTCSANVLRWQFSSEQTKRRTRRDTTTGLPAAGRSRGTRRYEPCIRPDQHPHPGQGACRAVVRASTRTALSATLTDTTDTPSIEKNSNSSSCSRSLTTKDCRPQCVPAGRFSGDLNPHHTKINSHPAYATTRSGPEPAQTSKANYHRAAAGHLRWRTAEKEGGPGLPPSSRAIVSPYDTTARYATHGHIIRWKGHSAHLTETCAPDGPKRDHGRGYHRGHHPRLGAPGGVERHDGGSRRYPPGGYHDVRPLCLRVAFFLVDAMTSAWGRYVITPTYRQVAVVILRRTRR